MDLLFRISFVLTWTIIANPVYVHSQGGGGLAIGLGGDLMVDTLFGEMPNPLLAIASNSAIGNNVQHGNTAGNNVFGSPHGSSMGHTGGGSDAANIFLNLFGSASAPVLFPGTHSTPVINSPVVFLPSSIGISDSHQPTHTASNPNIQQTQGADYHLQNEAFTALGNVGHLVRVPVGPVGQTFSPVATIQINHLNEQHTAPGNTTNAKETIHETHIVSMTANNSSPEESTNRAISITGEPVAMFNPGTGMVSEMAVLHSSVTGDRVDMSAFAPPPFTTKQSPVKATTRISSPINPYTTESKPVTNSVETVSENFSTSPWQETSYISDTAFSISNIQEQNNISKASNETHNSQFETNQPHTIDSTQTNIVLNSNKQISILTTSPNVPVQSSGSQNLAFPSTVTQKRGHLLSEAHDPVYQSTDAQAPVYSPAGIIHPENPSNDLQNPEFPSIGSQNSVTQSIGGKKHEYPLGFAHNSIFSTNDALKPTHPSYNPTSPSNDTQRPTHPSTYAPTPVYLSTDSKNPTVLPTNSPNPVYPSIDTRIPTYQPTDRQTPVYSSTFGNQSPVFSSNDAPLNPSTGTQNPTYSSPDRFSSLPMDYRHVRYDTQTIAPSIQTPPSITQNSYVVMSSITTQSPIPSTVSASTSGPAVGAFIEKPTRTMQQNELIADTSQFLSGSAREISIQDPQNYITVMGNVVGVLGSKELSTMQYPGVSTDLNSKSTAANQDNFGTGSVPDVLLGTNGAPITNMAGIRFPTMNTDPNQLRQSGIPNFNSFFNPTGNTNTAGSPPKTTASTTSTGPNDQLATGSFIIGAGQPNARVVQSSYIPQPMSPTSSSLGIGHINNNQNTENQGFAVDLSAFTPPSYDIPSVNISSFNRALSGLSVQPAVQNAVQENLITTVSPVNDMRVRAFTTSSEPRQTTPQTLNAPVDSIQVRTDIQSLSNTNHQNNINEIQRKVSPAELTSNFLETLPKEQRPQEIINVKPGWAKNFFPSRNQRNSQIQSQLPTNNLLSMNSNRLESFINRNPNQTSRHQVHRKPVVGSIFGESNSKSQVTVPPTILQQSRISSTPAVDFMQTFLNDRNFKSFNVPMPTLKDTSAPMVNTRDAKNVNQFGVAEIYTREQKLNQSQWRDLLSSMNNKKATRPDNIQYQTLNVVGASHTKPFLQNEINSVQTRFIPRMNNGILNSIPRPKRVILNSGIRTTFEAPGMNRYNKEGFRNAALNVPSASTILRNSNPVISIPERREFVQPNPSPDKSTAPALGGTIEMPMFQQLGIQKNLVSDPNSGSTREFNSVAAKSADPNMNIQPSVASSAASPQKVFTIGQSINMGDSPSSLNRNNILSGTPLGLDSMNMNQFASTGLRLGQPFIKNSFDNQSPTGNMNDRNTVLSNAQQKPETQFTAGNRKAVFGGTGSNTARTLSPRTQLTSAGENLKPRVSNIKCHFKADPNSRHHFYLQLRTFRHRFRCALGSAFDIETCECSTRVTNNGDCLEVHMDFNNGIVEDSSINRLPIGNENVEVTNKSTPLTGIALFGDNSKLTIWRYQNYDFRDHVMLKVQFRPGPGGGRFQPLISNCDGTGGGPSVGIVYDSQLNEAVLMLKTENDTRKELRFAVNPNEWNDVTYIYDGQEFIGIVNGVRRYVSRQDPHLLGIIGGEIRSTPTQGIIEIRDAALVLGFCPRYGHYVGAMVDIQVYTCIPKDFRLE